MQEECAKIASSLVPLHGLSGIRELHPGLAVQLAACNFLADAHHLLRAAAVPHPQL